MKKKLYVLATSIFLVLTLAVLSGCGQSATQTPNTTSTSTSTSTPVKPIELTLQSLVPPSHYVYTLTKEWAQKVEQQTGGKVKINIVAPGALAAGPVSHEALLNKVMDINLTAANFTPDKFPLTSSITRSMLGASVADSSRIIRELYKKYPEIQKEFTGSHVVTLYASSGMDFVTKSPVRTLEDLKGKRLRTTGDLVPYAKALGANPVSMGMDEVVVSLQKGVIDGAFTPGESITGWKLDEVSKYTTAVQLFKGVMFIAVNQKTWDTLPTDVQAVMDGLSEWFSDASGKAADEKTTEAYKYSKEHGGEIINLSTKDNEELLSRINAVNVPIIADLQAKGLPAKAIQDDINKLLKK